MRRWMLTRLWQSLQNKYMYQIIMSYPLKLYNVTCQLYFFLNLFLLGNSWFTVFSQFRLYSIKWPSYMYVYTLFLMVFHHVLSQEARYSSLWYSRTSLLIHSKCNSLHLLAPNSPSIPLPSPLLLGNHKSALYVHESISVL